MSRITKLFLLTLSSLTVACGAPQQLPRVVAFTETVHYAYDVRETLYQLDDIGGRCRQQYHHGILEIAVVSNHEVVATCTALAN